MLIEWSKELETGVEEMDNQHKKLIALMNQVYALLREGKKEDACNFFREGLLSYVEKHLSDEEEFMRKIGYPELPAHEKLHEVFRREVQKLHGSVCEGDVKRFAQELSFCWGWIYTHIAKADKKYGKWAKEKGVLK